MLNTINNLHNRRRISQMGEPGNVEPENRIEVVPNPVHPPLTAHEEAILEAGRRLMVESIDVSRDFAKQMITVTSGAIPIYLGLLSIAKLQQRAPATLFLSSMPAVSFFLSALFFVLALLPREGFFSLQIINEVRNARNKLLRRRRRWIMAGLTVFGVGVLSAIAVTLSLMGTTR